MRVLFLTHYFPPEVGAPQARISALARGLQRSGVQVTVHTGFPNYPTGKIQSPYRNRPFQVEEHDDGVRVVRSAVIPTPNRGFAPRVANHLGLCASALAAAAVSGPQDVVIAESPPLPTAAAGVLYARLKRAPLIVNVADLWPASAVQLGALSNERAIRAAEAMEGWIYREARSITVPTDGIFRTLSENPATAEKVRRVPPFVDPGRFLETAPPRADVLRVLYAGTIGLAQGLTTLVDAAALAGPAVAEVSIAGWGADGAVVRRRIAETEARNVKLLGLVPRERVASLYAAHDVGVVLLRDRPVLREALPTKMFECMAACRPVVVSARGEAADLVRRTEAGVIVEPEDPRALAEAFAELRERPADLAEMGRRGREHVERHSGLAAAVERWRDVIHAVAGEASVSLP